jgi:EAL domain-containing protein (putative c-di-GMP-specific phosphodiesterase class I)/FixJ family two-component response regulator/GGDEF domain-containing protein
MSKSLLIVDDEVGILNALSRLLIRHGYVVKTANSAEEALKILQGYACKVVLTDFRMPGTDGAALLEQVRRLYPDIVPLVISGYADFASVKTLLNAGTAFKFLEKPWLDKELLGEIALAVQHYDQRYFQSQAQKIMRDSTDALLEIAKDGQITRANASAKKLFACAADIEGQLLPELVMQGDKDKIGDLLHTMGDSVPLTLLNKTELDVSCQLAGPLGAVLLLEPVADGILLNTVFDMPALLNYRQLLSLIERYVANSRPLALVTLKVRSFATWSSFLGYSEAERVLESVAVQLLSATSRVGELAFLANEQFVILLPDLVDEMQVLQQISVIIEPITKQCTDNKLTVDFAVSYCLMPEDGYEPRPLLNNLLLGNVMMAESAVRMFIRYNRQAVERKKYHMAISQALHQAVSSQQLFLHFHPKFDLSQQRLSGCEVLLRWQHPEFGLVPPSLFIPLAEQQGQIVDIGHWALKQAFKTLACWQKQGIDVGKLAVNISGRQLMEPDFLNWIRHYIGQAGVRPDQLEFELTETFLLDNFDDCAAKLKALSDLGISIAIDDFGTGYSSLHYLNKLPINVLKLDRSLVSDVDCNINTQSLIANVIRLAHDLNLQVVIEGVETVEQLNIVKTMGADVVQGYYISMPMPEKKFMELLTSYDKVTLPKGFWGDDV